MKVYAHIRAHRQLGVESGGCPDVLNHEESGRQSVYRPLTTIH